MFSCFSTNKHLDKYNLNSDDYNAISLENQVLL